MNKKGFTLIELLAIIVILAIIAVITVPLILGIIDESKQKASVASAYGFKEGIEKDYAKRLLNNNTQNLNGTYTITNGKINNQDVSISGTKPSNGTLTYQNNKLVSGCLTIDGYKVQYQNDEFTATKGDCEINQLLTLQLITDIDDNDIVTAWDEIAIGTEHFYVLDDEGSNITLLAKYSLEVGFKIERCDVEYDWECQISEISNPSGIQESNAGIYQNGTIIGLTNFSEEDYWKNYVQEYPSYIYNPNSLTYNYVQDYINYLKTQGAPSTTTGRLIKLNELKQLGYETINPVSWIGDNYWTGIACEPDGDYYGVMLADGGCIPYISEEDGSSIRPIIEIPKVNLENYSNVDTLYFTYDSNAEEGPNGKITIKQNMPNPSWEYYIKEKNYTNINGYKISNDEGLIVEDAIFFYTENECLTKLNSLPAQDVEQEQLSCMSTTKKIYEVCGKNTYSDQITEFCLLENNTTMSINVINDAFPGCYEDNDQDEAECYVRDTNYDILFGVIINSNHILIGNSNMEYGCELFDGVGTCGNG